MEVLSLLSSQAAISLENAQLYETMRRLNEDLRLEIQEKGKVQEALQNSETELRRHRDHLQSLVEERTAKLQEANDRLQKDMAEKVRLSAQLAQSEKLAAVGQLAAGVAHEINNPLGVILGFSQSVLHRTPQDHPLLKPIQAIEREAERCKRLVQDLLIYSRAGKRDKESLDFNQVVDSTFSSFQESLPAGFCCVKDFQPQLPPLPLDLGQIQQVIVNLCSNAVDAMPQGGTLTLRTRLVERSQKTFVELQVQDTGIGIPPEIQSRIFEPFFTTKEVGKGTGLGLALVYEIVKDHGGSVEFESRPGQGTLFCIFFPAPERPSK
jgi:signal transduction histidine kinase